MQPEGAPTATNAAYHLHDLAEALLAAEGEDRVGLLVAWRILLGPDYDRDADRLAVAESLAADRTPLPAFIPPF